MTYPEPHVLPFLEISSPNAGSLVTTQHERQLPFAVERVFWVYDTPAGVTRGGHAHRTTQEVLTVLNGTVRIETETNLQKAHFTLTDPSQGIYIPPLCWIKVVPSPGAILCCMASTVYNEQDYIRDYQAFQQLLKR